MVSMTQRSTAVKPSGPRFRFIRETIAELRKVVWLSRREAAYLSGLVLLVAITAGVVLAVIDYGFSKLINFFLGG
jgi:preprotein translocase subunit SecE